MKRADLILLVIALAAFAAGIYYRGHDLNSRSLEYDEIWALEHYLSLPAAEVFTTLSVPNNHSLHTLLCQYSCAVFGQTPWALRLPSFIAGILFIPAAGLIAYLLSGARMAVFMAVIFAAADGALAHYSQTARGYSLQALMVAMLIVFILCTERFRQKPRLHLAFPCGTFLCSAGTILCVPTGVLFVFPLLALHGFYLLRKEQRLRALLKDNIALIIFYFVLAVSVLLYYLGNYSQLKDASAHGRQIASLPDAGRFVWMLLSKLIYNPVPLLAFWALFCFRKCRPLAWAGAVFLLFPVVFALFFKAGPPRAYLPLLAGLLPLGACGVNALSDHFRNRKVLAILIAALAIIASGFGFHGSFKAWTPPDWKEIFLDISKNIPLNALVIYPAAESYPIIFNNRPQVVMDHFSRLAEPGRKAVAIVGSKGISGIDLQRNFRALKLPERNAVISEAGNTEITLYPLLKLKQPTADSAVYIACVEPVNAPLHKAACLHLLTDKSTDWLLLNPWLNKLSLVQNGVDLKCALLGCNSADPAKLIEIERRSHGVITFYYIPAASPPLAAGANRH